tara:strand:+ start:1168 stop:1326 length:159 start_codon:yes stop_codon:yes gene_type:complete
MNLPPDLPIFTVIFAFILMIWILPIVLIFLVTHYLLMTPLNYILKLRKRNED